MIPQVNREKRVNKRNPQTKKGMCDGIDKKTR